MMDAPQDTVYAPGQDLGPQHVLEGAGDFDVAAWLADATPPRRSVRVVGRADLLAQWQDLERDLVEAKQRGGRGRLVGSGEHAIAQEMTEVQQAMQASTRTFVVRALSDEEQAAADAMLGEYPDTPVGRAARANERIAQWMAIGCITPRLTLEQARALRERIGEGQYAALWDALWRASTELSVDVPFSLAHSVAASTPGS